MVSLRAKILFAIVIATTASIALPAVDFRMEFSKPVIYVGEQVICNFSVYADEEVMEVEVAKFPEFRGYWKENLALRQGPITGAPIPGSHGFKIIVGTYVVVPMLAQRDSEIQAMKIVARNPLARKVEGSAPPEFVLSVGELPKVIELPPLPSGEDHKSFTGAVGGFTFYQGDTAITYQRGEPAQFRLTLTGQGNFPELNELPLSFPPNIEVLSKRAFMQGSGQFSAKSFEYTVNVHDDKDFELDPGKFIYFDPAQKKYVALTAPTLHLKFVQTAEPTDERNGQLPKLELPDTHWTKHYRVERSWGFFVVNVILVWLALLLVVARIISVRRARRANDPRLLRRKKFNRALAILREGDVPWFLKIADEIASEILAKKLGLSTSALTRAQLVEEAKKRGWDETTVSATQIFTAYEQAAFSPNHEQSLDTKALVEDLSKLMRERV